MSPSLRLKTMAVWPTALVAAAASFASPAARAQEVAAGPAVEEPVTLDDLYQATAPYGDWIDTPEYGRVWRPSDESVGEGFEPYATNGQWEPTDAGWYFDSAFSWGWAPFHYGRWVFDGARGWLWRPDTVWAPAWVQWRSDAGVIAWLPLVPANVTVDPRAYTALWIAVEIRNFLRPDVSRSRIAPPARVIAARAVPPTLPPKVRPVAPLRGRPPATLTPAVMLRPAPRAAPPGPAVVRARAPGR
jgi:hypothetical protein